MNKLSYDNPALITYGLGAIDFGTLAAGTEVSAIPVPLGVGRCKIESIAIHATEVFTDGAKVEIGDASDPNKYAELLIGTLADTDALDFTDPENQQFDTGYGGKGVVDIAEESLTQLELTLTGSGAMGTGIGFVNISVAWW